MRVSLIDPSLFTLPYDRALAEGLSRTGHDVVLHGRALQPEDGSAGRVSLQADFYRVADSPLGRRLPSPFRLAVKGVDHAWSALRLLRRLQQRQPDVIHFQWLPLPLLDGALLGRFRKIAPLVLTVHDTNPFNGDPSASLQGRGFRRCLQKFDRLVVHTAQGAERMRGMGVPAHRLDVLPHGMLIEAAAGPPDPMSGTLTFMLFGKIKPYKGADLLVDAFAALPDALRSQARVRIVGKPYIDLGPIEAKIAASRLDVRIEPGFVADAAIPGLFGSSTVATFPYREIEASGVMFLALAHGRPVIASRLGSFGELLTDGTHGRLLPPGDVGALSAAMAQMIAGRDFAAGCAAAVSTLAAGVPSWDEIARRTVLTYRGAGVAAIKESPRLASATAQG